MKPILYILINIILFVGFSENIQAQEVDNPQEVFAEKEWYLTKIVMEGEEYSFVPTGAVPNSSLETQELYESNHGNTLAGISVSHCEMCDTSVQFLSQSEFKIYNGMYTWTCLAYDNCMYSTDPELLAFAGLYEINFWDGEYTGEFNYEFKITEIERGFSLVITKEDGSQAYYNDVPLAVSTFEHEMVKLYPNPMSNQLYIEGLSESTELAIYDISGQKLLNQEVNTSTESIDVSNLSAGIYLYAFKRDGKSLKTGKLIKE